MSAGGFWQRLFVGTHSLRYRCDWPGYVGSGWAERIMSTAITDRFHAKQGRSTGRWFTRSPQGRLVVYLKRHRRLPWWRRLLATLWPDHGWSPAFAEWRHLKWAEERGIPVPEAIAAGEFVGPWFRLESFLAIKELTGMAPLHEAVPSALAVLSPGTFERWKRRIIVEVARLTRLFHEAQRYHKDLYLCHFFAHDGFNPDAVVPGNIAVIDLHRMEHHPWTGGHWRVKDLAQLLYSSDIPGLNNRDRLRFFHLYLNQPKLDDASRRLLRRVVAKAERYRRHNARFVQFVKRQEVKAA
jgi:heptose I phosphotransferase